AGICQISSADLPAVVIIHSQGIKNRRDPAKVKSNNPPCRIIVRCKRAREGAARAVRLVIELLIPCEFSGSLLMVWVPPSSANQSSFCKSIEVVEPCGTQE